MDPEADLEALQALAELASQPTEPRLRKVLAHDWRAYPRILEMLDDLPQRESPTVLASHARKLFREAVEALGPAFRTDTAELSPIDILRVHVVGDTTWESIIADQLQNGRQVGRATLIRHQKLALKHVLRWASGSSPSGEPVVAPALTSGSTPPAPDSNPLHAAAAAPSPLPNGLPASHKLHRLRPSRVVGALALCLLFAATVVLAYSNSSRPGTFSDNFSVPSHTWKSFEVLSGNWDIYNAGGNHENALRGVSAPTQGTFGPYSPGLILIRDRKWDEFLLEFDVQGVDALDRFCVFSYRTNFDTFAFSLRPPFGDTLGDATLIGNVPGSSETQLKRVDYPNENGRWYHVRVEFRKDAVRVYLDDALEPLIQYAAPRAFQRKGKIGFALGTNNGEPGVTTLFDNVRIAAL